MKIMAANLKILLLEDNATDAELVERLVKKELITVEFAHAANKSEYLEQLSTFLPEVILADNSLPQFSATEALQLLRQQSQHIPFILITGTVSEEFAAGVIKQGADDYILKDRLVRLPSAIDAAVRQRRAAKEKQKAVETIIEGEEKYRTLVERVSDGFIALDKEWCYTYVNKKIGEMTGMSPELLLGKNIWEAFPAAVGSGTYKAFYKAMDTQQYINNIDYYEPLDLWQENSIYPSADGLSVFIRDITKQKKAEEELKRAHSRLLFHVENAPLGFIEWDSQLNVKSWSKRAEEIFGWSEQEFKEKQKQGYSTIYTEDMPMLMEIAQQLLEGKLERYSIQNRNYTKNGKMIWCEWFNSVLKNEDGKVGTILSLVQDITDRKKAEDLIKKSYDDIRELASHLQDVREEERTSMAREIHDELGQQLTGFKMDIAWLNRKLQTDEEAIKEKIQATLQLIDASIKTVRRISTDLRPSILDDLGFITAMEWQSDEFQKRSGIKVDFKNKVDEIAMVPKVTIALFRIYQELLTNVARHANGSLVTSLLYKEDGHLCLKVSDNGAGFDVNNIGARKTLGLLGIKERTLLMEGTYAIKSAPGEGTIVIITVPLNNVIQT